MYYGYIFHSYYFWHTCIQAYHKDIHYPKHIVITIGRSRRLWWRQEVPGLNCTADQRESVLPSSLAVTENRFLYEENDGNVTSTSGMVGQNSYPCNKGLILFHNRPVQSFLLKKRGILGSLH